MRKYQKFGGKKEYIKKVIQKANDLQTVKGSGSGVVAKPCNDKAGNIQHTAGVDVRQ
jgi:hypothetical protein